MKGSASCDTAEYISIIITTTMLIAPASQNWGL